MIYQFSWEPSSPNSPHFRKLLRGSQHFVTQSGFGEKIEVLHFEKRNLRICMSMRCHLSTLTRKFAVSFSSQGQALTIIYQLSSKRAALDSLDFEKPFSESHVWSTRVN